MHQIHFVVFRNQRIVSVIYLRNNGLVFWSDLSLVLVEGAQSGLDALPGLHEGGAAGLLPREVRQSARDDCAQQQHSVSQQLQQKTNKVFSTSRKCFSFSAQSLVLGKLRVAKLIAASDPSSGNLTPQVTSPPLYRLLTCSPLFSTLFFNRQKTSQDRKMLTFKSSFFRCEVET